MPKRPHYTARNNVAYPRLRVSGYLDNEPVGAHLVNAEGKRVAKKGQRWEGKYSVTKYYRPVIVRLTEYQARRLVQGYRVNLNTNQFTLNLDDDRGEEVYVTDRQYQKMVKASENGVGVMLQMNPTLIRYNRNQAASARRQGGSLWSALQSLGSDARQWWQQKGRPRVVDAFGNVGSNISRRLHGATSGLVDVDFGSAGRRLADRGMGRLGFGIRKKRHGAGFFDFVKSVVRPAATFGVQQLGNLAQGQLRQHTGLDIPIGDIGSQLTDKGLQRAGLGMRGRRGGSFRVASY